MEFFSEIVKKLYRELIKSTVFYINKFYHSKFFEISFLFYFLLIMGCFMVADHFYVFVVITNFF